MKCVWGGQVSAGLGVVLFWALQAGNLAAEEGAMGVKPEGWVERALFTTGVIDREPVDQVTVLDTGRADIYFYTELQQLTGHLVIHRWEYEGQVVSEVPFEVDGPRWRVYSKKSLLPTQTGTWTVVVMDESGWALHAAMFDYRLADDIQPNVNEAEPPPAQQAVPQQDPPAQPYPPPAQDESALPDAQSPPPLPGP